MKSIIIEDKDLSSKIISEYFLTKKELTPKKIQKLVYYAYAWFITLNNDDEDNICNSLLNEEPEAWLHGPVFPNLYQEYKVYGWHEVPKIDCSISFENDDLKPFLDKIWETFGSFSADELEYMTHQEMPWINARKSNEPNKIISKVDIFNFYNEL